MFIALTVLFPVASAEPALGAHVLRRDRFEIWFPNGQQSLAEYTAAVLEEAVLEFDPLLPVGDTPIRVLIVDVPEEFEKYAVHFGGLDVSGLAQPQRDLIIVKAPRLRRPGSDYPGTVRHELVHLLLYRNVNYDYLPQWLNEGIAMSLANEFYWQSLFKIARMFIQNRIIPYRQLDQSFYAPTGPVQFSDAYAQALSMTRFLRDRLGEAAFWEMVLKLRNEPFPEALQSIAGLSVIEFWDLYRKALWKYAVIAALASGFFFQPGAVLLILAYLRRRRIARDIYKRWEDEELAAAAGFAESGVADWDSFVEDPDAWKEGYDDEEE